jgi:hypothetical protein
MNPKMYFLLREYEEESLKLFQREEDNTYTLKMKAIPQKSKLKHITHNPTGELVRIITEKSRAWLRLRAINKEFKS